jgi:hypothetical protein
VRGKLSGKLRATKNKIEIKIGCNFNLYKSKEFQTVSQVLTPYWGT